MDNNNSISANNILAHLSQVLHQRRQADPDSSYTARLLHKGQESILKKVAEEAAETLMASKDQDGPHLVREVADLWFHCLVLLEWHGLNATDVLEELARREGLSGLEEKARRPAAV